MAKKKSKRESKKQIQERAMEAFFKAGDASAGILAAWLANSVDYLGIGFVGRVRQTRTNACTI